MKSKVLSRLTYSSIAYALVVLGTAICSLIADGAQASVDALYFIELIAVIAAVELVDIVCWRVFGRAVAALIAGLIVELAAVIGLGVLFGWYDFTWASLIAPVVITVVVYALVYWASYVKSRADAQKINEKLRENQSSAQK